MNKLQTIAQQIAGHIQKPMTADEIADALESGDYSAELIMQHLLLLACPKWRYFRYRHTIWKMPRDGEEGFSRSDENSCWIPSGATLLDCLLDLSLTEITPEEGEQ